MAGYTTNIERDTLENEAFRKVLYTGSYLQLVLMSVAAGDEIGEEVHGQDQFIRVEEGEGKAVLDGEEHALSDGFVVVIPAGTKHNIINTSASDALKLYTIYAPPHHADGTVHQTKAEADKAEEEFHGDTSE
ncbi:MAG: cupin domain-containing protein [Candidatus Pacebacteria bacterium]|nr:cupin domain-containing protein [Candidatus Paceibacterota bacterium]MBP9840289.1 cupin domain-containing protein [Candidatus Paceibacterota bacterium]